MIEYLACGNCMSDEIIQPNGERSTRHMGGPAFFALSGIRLWTKNVKLVCRTGADFYDTYGVWLKENGLTDESVRVDCDNMSCYVIQYDENGTGIGGKSYYGDENLGYIKTHPEDIDEACGPDVKGIYFATGAELVVWDKLEQVKKKHGYKMMWELEYFNSGKDFERLKKVAHIPEMWSLNNKEAAEMFGRDPKDDLYLIQKVQELTNELCLYRVGHRGAYAVTKEHAYYLPPAAVFPYVDQTGCGNCSTGAAMYAHASGCTPEETVVIANISAAYNVAQYGVFPLVTDEEMARAQKVKQELLSKVEQVL